MYVFEPHLNGRPIPSCPPVPPVPSSIEIHERWQSQELSSSLTALRKSRPTGDGYSSGGSSRRGVSRGAGRVAEREWPAAEEEEEGEARRAHVFSTSGGVEERKQQRRQGSATAVAAPTMDPLAGREISDIDRRLGELHEFLKRAKEGGLGALPLPPAPPSTAESRSPRPLASVIAPEVAVSPPPAGGAAGDDDEDAARLSGSIPAAAAESRTFELSEEKSQSSPPPPAADVAGQVGGVQRKSGSRSVDDGDDAGVVENWQQGGGAGSGAWHVDEVEE